MSYMYVIVCSIADTQTFVEAGRTWMGEKLSGMGAKSTMANEVVMGGDMAGKVLVAFETDTVDEAMALQADLYADKETLSLIRDTQVQVHRRSLMRTQAEFGSREGTYGSALYLSSLPVDDATMQKNCSVNWEHLQKGANGMTALNIVAGGSSPFSHVVTTRTNSLDSLLAASVQNFADPAVQKIMAGLNIKVLGRVLTRRLF